MLTDLGRKAKNIFKSAYISLLTFIQRLPTIYKKYPLYGWMGMLAGVLVGISITIFAIAYLLVLLGAGGKIPSSGELENIQHDLASEIYSADGQILGLYYNQNRTSVLYEEIPSNLIEALIATEDVRFYQHKGIDIKSMFRVLAKTILLADRASGGGSTITQQLAKNLYPRQGNGSYALLMSKMREMMIARRLENTYTKEEILSLYLNTVPFGENLYGIESAARRFYDTSVDSLETHQSAVLVGMLKANTYYNPRLYPDRSLLRRNVVFTQMNKYGYLNQEQLDSLQNLPLSLQYTYIDQHAGLATHFREFVRKKIVIWLKDHPKEDGSLYDLYSDGLKIYTTIDSRMQFYAEQSMKEHLEKLQEIFDDHWKGRKAWSRLKEVTMSGVRRSARYRKLKDKGMSDKAIYAEFKKEVPMQVFSWEHGGGVDTLLSPLDSVIYYQYVLHSGLMAMDPSNGNIRAYVGGFNHRFFPYDHAQARRQVGSTFKPLVYASALEAEIEPCDLIPNEKRTYEKYDNWTPGNADGQYGGYYSMKGGLTHSVNTVAVQLIMKCGPSSVVRLARNMGIDKEIPENDPSLSLGTADLSLMDMVPVYSTFANIGTYTAPRYILRIEDKDGKVIYDGEADVYRKQVLSKKSARLTLAMLESVVDSGTARSLRYTYGRNEDLAGKTGTTQDQADGWFMGVTPNLVVGVWVGADDRRMHFRNLQLGQGARTALPIFAQFLNQVYEDDHFKTLQTSRFPSLSPELAQELDCPLFVQRKRNKLIDLQFKELFQKRKKRILENRRKKRKKKRKRKLF